MKQLFEVSFILLKRKDKDIESGLEPLIGSNISYQTHAATATEAMENVQHLAELDYPDCEVSITGCLTSLRA